MVRFEKSKLWEAEMKNVLDKASPLQEDHFSCADPQICSQSQYKWKVRAISHLLPAQVWHMTSAATQKPCQDFRIFNSVHFSSVTQLCQNLCDFMERTTPGLPVHHQPPESNQTHVHWVSDAIQPSDPLSSPSPPALNLSQNQGLCQGVSSLPSGDQNIVVSASASVLLMNIQCWFPLGLTGWISLQSKRLSSVLSNTTAQKHQFFGAQLSL